MNHKLHVVAECKYEPLVVTWSRLRKRFRRRGMVVWTSSYGNDSQWNDLWLANKSKVIESANATKAMGEIGGLAKYSQRVNDWFYETPPHRVTYVHVRRTTDIYRDPAFIAPKIVI